MSPIVNSYLAYTILSLAATIWVARTLHQRGRVFLLNAFDGDTDLADSVNTLLVVGFYLINVGFVSLNLRAYGDPAGARQSIELVADKVGFAWLLLGGMHFFNLFILQRIWRRGQSRRSPFPPVAPDATLGGLQG